MRQVESARVKALAPGAMASQAIPRRNKPAERKRYRQKARLRRSFTVKAEESRSDHLGDHLGEGSVGDKRVYTLRRRNAKKRIPVKGWALSKMEQDPERVKNRPILSPTLLALSPGRTRAGS